MAGVLLRMRRRLLFSVELKRRCGPYEADMNAARGRRALLVRCHPVGSGLLIAAAERAEQSLRIAGVEVRVIDLYADGFNPVAEVPGYHEADDDGSPSHADAVRMQQRILEHSKDSLAWCTDLVLAYPTWYGQMPAMLKGWFDQLWLQPARQPERQPERQPVTNASGSFQLAWKQAGLLSNVSTVWVVTTHGSPRFLNRCQGEAGLRFIRRLTLVTTGRKCRMRWVAFYGNDGASDTDRAVYLDRVTERFRRV
jgi:NAD(P)H dehydrogenase (quinone)